MFAEFGLFFLLCAWCLGLLQIATSAVGLYKFSWITYWAKPLTYAHFMGLLLSFLGLSAAFLNNDFSIRYIAEHSNSLMPWYYKLSGVWGGHEGSMLLWLLILSGWAASVAYFGQKLPHPFYVRVLLVLVAIQVAIGAYVIFASSPFMSLLPTLPVDGAELNPLLQDPGLIFHPPTLYMGYVGLAVPFAFVIAGLWMGRIDSLWAQWCRPWVLTAWGFLTLGIALGSWWAYYELGWGGWWFWDPVENASFMPWLASTALLHSFIATDKRGVFKGWTALLAILSFALSLLGTFLVRSGVITSVHAFAADPLRGLFILIILSIVVGGGLSLYAFKAWKLLKETRYSLVSRENLLVANNLILLTAVLVVFLGTLYPLFADALKLGQVSVGAPYFNALFRPLAWLLLLVMALAPWLHYKKQSATHQQLLKKPLLIAALVSASVGVVAYVVYHTLTVWARLDIAITLSLCAWVIVCLLFSVVRRKGLQDLRFAAMLFAHVGVILSVIGVLLTSHLSTSRDVALAMGESVQLGAYTFTLDNVHEHTEQNYRAVRATISVYQAPHHTLRATLHPEKRFHFTVQRPMTEAGIQARLLRDVYVSIGEPLDSAVKTRWFSPMDVQSDADITLTDSRISFSLYIKPYVRFIWLGALFMVFGAVLATIALVRRSPVSLSH